MSVATPQSSCPASAVVGNRDLKTSSIWGTTGGASDTFGSLEGGSRNPSFAGRPERSNFLGSNQTNLNQEDDHHDRLDSATRHPTHPHRGGSPRDNVMLTFLVWLLLLIVAWPLALLALLLYPIVWLLSIPFRLVGFSVRAVLELVWALITLPARVLQGPTVVRPA